MQTVRRGFGRSVVFGRLVVPSRHPRVLARLEELPSAELDRRVERFGVWAGSVWRGVAGPMRLGCELLLPYPGFCGFDGVCHVRVLEPLGRLACRQPVVIVGALEDSSGTSITNVIEIVAAAVRREVFPEGRRFLLVEHYADRCKPEFAIVRFKRSERQPSHEIWAHLGRLHVQIGSHGPSLVAPPGLLLSGFGNRGGIPCSTRSWRQSSAARSGFGLLASTRRRRLQAARAGG